jgi:hypothetical protein
MDPWMLSCVVSIRRKIAALPRAPMPRDERLEHRLECDGLQFVDHCFQLSDTIAHLWNRHTAHQVPELDPIELAGGVCGARAD